ncbi:MAG TPA: isocitrate lyase/phosphoenolpyruvate mutase family protein [Pseudonocardia sp.]|nr:isocitrate lyase/phosphoenolpyruvate mutase family protein [Pseudonocardia sp.]
MHDSASDRVLVLPNAWDAGSAAVIADAGAQAIATTSGGMAWAHGRPDGQQLTREEVLAAVRRIVAAVDVPVTVDAEGGYGPGAEDVAATVEGVVAAGAVGLNLEDSTAAGGPLLEPADQAERIRAARDAAASSGLPELVVNARTDVFLFGIGAPSGRFDEVVRRGEAYADAGADVLFVPGLVDLGVLESLAAACPLPVNAMAVPGGPTVAEFAGAGVRRVSAGTGIAQAAYTLARRAAAELLSEGTTSAVRGSLDFGEINGLFAV